MKEFDAKELAQAARRWPCKPEALARRIQEAKENRKLVYFVSTWMTVKQAEMVLSEMGRPQ